MQEKAKERFRALMAAELARLGDDDAGAREAVQAKMKAAVEALIQRNAMADAEAAGLREALAQVLAEGSGEPVKGKAAFPPLELDSRPAVQPPPPRRSGLAMRAAIGAIALAAVVGGAIVLHPGIASALQASGDAPAAANPEIAKFEARLQTSAKAVNDAANYLNKVQKAVEARLKADPVTLTALAGEKFTSLKAIDGELHKSMPRSIRKGAEITVRATPTGYKVLLKTGLCTDIKYTKPKYVDPKRDLKTAGCQFAGVWNAAGREF